jgi:hypothetical protein
MVGSGLRLDPTNSTQITALTARRTSMSTTNTPVAAGQTQAADAAAAKLAPNVAKGPDEIAKATIDPLPAPIVQPAAAAAAAAAATVTMKFPHDVTLTVTHAKQIVFKAGVQEVPVEYADHPYLKSNGAVKYDGKGKSTEEPVDLNAQLAAINAAAATLAAERAAFEKEKAAAK